jgi:cobalt-zinc-cadmium efflux system protein
MSHDHCHDHHHAHRTANKRRLMLTLLLAGGYMLAEIVGGLITHSLALLADAGHMFSDVAALGLSLFALAIAERPPTAQRTFGYYRTEILAALANGGTLIAVSIFVFVEAYRRWLDPPEVQGGLMMAIAVGGLAVNLMSLRILGHGTEENLNIRGAWLHVLTDALGSVGAIAAGAIIWTLGWYWVDPAASVVIGLLVIYSAWRLVAESVSVLMENAPRGIDVDEVRDTLAGVPGVTGVHDLHVWTITSGLDSLSAHLVMADGHAPAELLTRVRHQLHEHFGIDHVTIQVEPEDFGECRNGCEGSRQKVTDCRPKQER